MTGKISELWGPRRTQREHDAGGGWGGAPGGPACAPSIVSLLAAAVARPRPRGWRRGEPPPGARARARARRSGAARVCAERGADGSLRRRAPPPTSPTRPAPTRARRAPALALPRVADAFRSRSRAGLRGTGRRRRNLPRTGRLWRTSAARLSGHLHDFGRRWAKVVQVPPEVATDWTWATLGQIRWIPATKVGRISSQIDITLMDAGKTWVNSGQCWSILGQLWSISGICVGLVEAEPGVTESGRPFRSIPGHFWSVSGIFG